MRLALVRLFVALLTFVVGVSASAFWQIFNPAPDVFEAVQLPIAEQAVLIAPSIPYDDDDSDRMFAVATIDGGLLDYKAISKPAPQFPAVARAAALRGIVAVQVVVDEMGKVVFARALTGHPLLHQSAVEAAYRARFAPTMTSGRPLRVSGVLTYTFKLD